MVSICLRPRLLPSLSPYQPVADSPAPDRVSVRGTIGLVSRDGVEKFSPRNDRDNGGSRRTCRDPIVFQETGQKDPVPTSFTLGVYLSLAAKFFESLVAGRARSSFRQSDGSNQLRGDPQVLGPPAGNGE